MDADTTLPDDVKEGVIQNILNGRWFSADLDAHYGNADLWAD
jgi:para-nitrobenzyl esterase